MYDFVNHKYSTAVVSYRATDHPKVMLGLIMNLLISSYNTSSFDVMQQVICRLCIIKLHNDIVTYLNEGLLPSILISRLAQFVSILEKFIAQ